MVKNLLSIAALLALSTVADAQSLISPDAVFGGNHAKWASAKTMSAGDMLFGYYTGDESTLSLWGNYKKESYDVAFYVSDPALVGAQVKSIRFYTPSCTYLSNVSGWLSDALSLKSYKNVPNIEADTIKAVDGWNEITFKTPYTITDKGLYVGYSFTVDTLGEDLDNTPVVLTSEKNSNGFFIHTSATYKRKWSNISSTVEGSSSAQIIISGGNLQSDAAAVGAVGKVVYGLNDPVKITLPVVNHGKNGIKSYDYTCVLNGETVTGHVDLTTPVEAFFGKSTSTVVTMPAITTKGEYTATSTITKVNGVDNADAAKSITSTVNIIAFRPQHRAMLEEYTGTWCGYCPRGWVGLKRMSELYPDDFIGISYHNGDDMEVTTTFPSKVPGFPDAWLDRDHETDAYAGDNGYSNGVMHFGIDETWKEACDVLAPASIDVKAAWTDDSQTAIKVTTTSNFVIPSSDANYKVAYALVSDSLTGTGSNWSQHNYYGGGSASYPDSDMDIFTSGKSTIDGLYFNDVIIDAKAINGIDGSITAPIVDGEAQTHTYTFDISKAVNTSGVSLVQNKKNLRVVAMLIDTTTGAIANANKAKVEVPTGIRNTSSAALNASVFVANGNVNITSSSNNRVVAEVFTANGQRVAKSTFSGSTSLPLSLKGVYMVRLSDGKNVSVHKVINL